MIITLLCAGPCIGYSAYLWNNKKRIASFGNTLPAMFAVLLAVVLLLFV